MPRRIAFWKQLAGVTILLGAAVLVWQQRTSIIATLGLGAFEAEPRSSRGAREVPVIVTRVSTAEDNLVLEAVGTGRANRSVVLRSEASGKITEMPLTSGARFRAGDVLLRLEDTKQRLSLALAETRLAEAGRIRERFTNLENAGTASVARGDEARTAFEIAEIELERAREALEDRVLRAPFDGIAGLPDVEVGAWIDSDVELASFDDRRVILVEFDLPESLIVRVSPEMPITASSPSAPGLLFEGTVVAIDSRIAAASRTARVRVAIPNHDERLRPGASFVVRMELSGGHYPVVPELAVNFARGAVHVWRIVDGTAELVEVRMVRRIDGNVLVEGPLSEGDLVVIEGTQRLTPGKTVRVLDRGRGGST